MINKGYQNFIPHTYTFTLEPRYENHYFLSLKEASSQTIM